MGTKKSPTRYRFSSTVAVDGDGTVQTDRVKPGEVRACQSIAFRNRSGTRGTVEIYLIRDGVEVFICDQSSPTANRWWWYPYVQHMIEGEQLIARQASCIASDILDLHIIGYKTYDSHGDIL